MLKSELEVLSFWKEKDVFAKSLENRAGKEPYVFLDGPPFVTGTPHYGHLSTGYPKDIFPRYWTQKGKYCVRRWGWDCHGLPIENLVQKQLEITDKRQIENEVGIDKFNQACRQNILGFDTQWRDVIERSGRWVDMDDQYRTMDNDYIESVWWGLGQLWNKGLLYQDYRSSMYAPSMGATLSHMEIADDVKYIDETLETPVVRFKVKTDSQRRLMDKVLEEITFNYSEQLKYQEDIKKRIISLEKLDEKSRKRSLSDLLKAGRLSGNEWDNVKSDLATDQELQHLRDQQQIIIQNLETLEKLKLILQRSEKLHLLAWTTTPWTLPANVSLVVGADIEYSMYFLPKTGEFVMVAENRAIPILSLQLEQQINTPELEEKLKNIDDSGEYFATLGVDIMKIVTLTGADLEGLEYEPLFATPENIGTYEEMASGWRVYTSEIVSDIDGTGIVHIAPAYGPDDFEIRKQRNLPLIKCLNEYGEMLDTIDPILKNAMGKPFSEANEVLMTVLDKTDRMFGQFSYTHKYPIYNRDNQKVYYAADENWYIGETKFVDRSLELNEQINWYPNHLKHGRFAKGLESAPDWCISRKRYWGSPLPIWQTKDRSKTMFIDSIEKLRSHAVNPIFRLVNSRDLSPDLYEDAKVVIMSDAQSKLPLGIAATQYRSKSLSDLRKEKNYSMQTFSHYAQKMLDEIIDLFEKYDTVQMLLDDHERQWWTTWLYSLHQNSKKIANTFYFYKRVEEDYDEYKGVGNIRMLDLHRPFIDDILLQDEGGNVYTRIQDVVDCWVESGSMPWASYHYPFENKEFVDKSLPADYIVEYEGQIRGWFHALHVLSTGIFDKQVFKNAHVHGTLLGNDSKKMSKSKGNYTDVDELLSKVGSDALRLFFAASPYFNGESLSLIDREVISVFKGSTLLLSNSISYVANVLEQFPRREITSNFKHPLNKWWMAYTQDYARKLDLYLESYNLIDAARLIAPFINDFSTWYIRRSKDILTDYGTEVASCLQETCRIFATVTASMQPFNTERLWSVVRQSSDSESVHLTEIIGYPAINEKQISLIERMAMVRELASEIHGVRKERQLRVRQPLYADFGQLKLEQGFLDILQKECNLLPHDLSKKEGELFEHSSDFGYLKVDLVVDRDLSVLGYARDFERAVQAFRKKKGYSQGQLISMKWELTEVEDDELLKMVLTAVDWDKINVEVKWVEGLDPQLDTHFSVKGLVKVIVD